MAARSRVRTLTRALVPNVSALPRDQRDAVNALAQHVLLRVEQTEFEPLDDDGKTFITVSHMQRLLRDVGAHRKGEKAAAEAIRWLCASGIIEDTGEIKLPRRDPKRTAAREKFEKQGKPSTSARDISNTGGRDAQPSHLRSYWWRVFRIVPLARVIRASASLQGAYAYVRDVPQALASLSAWASRQGLISRRRGRRGARPGSVQWAFANTGPP